MDFLGLLIRYGVGFLNKLLAGLGAEPIAELWGDFHEELVEFTTVGY